MGEFDYLATELGTAPPNGPSLIEVDDSDEEIESLSDRKVEEDEVHVLLKSDKSYVFRGSSDTFRDRYGLFEDKKTSEFSVSGITCSSCVNLIQSVLKDVPGVCSVCTKLC